MSYTELFAISNFTFLTGASHAAELVSRAKELGLQGLAITDKNTFSGIVRGHSAAKEAGLPYIVGTRLVLTDGTDLLAYPKTRDAFARLCRLLTLGKRRTVKGACELSQQDVLDHGAESVLIALDGPQFSRTLGKLKGAFADDVFIGLVPEYDGVDEDRFSARYELSQNLQLPCVALGSVLMHAGHRLRLADVLSCIRV